MVLMQQTMNANVNVSGGKGPGVGRRSCRRSIQRVTSDEVENPQDRGSNLNLALTRCQDGRPGVAVIVDVVVTDAAAGTVAVEIGLH